MIPREYRTVLFALCITLLLGVTLPLCGDSTKTAPRSVDSIVKSFRQDQSDVARARALRELVELGIDARDEIRSATEATQSDVERDLLRLASLKILAADLVVVIGKHQESQLVFDGQYNELEKKGSEVVDALVHVLNDEEVPDFIRSGAINAMADVGNEKLLSRVRELERDPLLEPELVTQLGLLMAILGDARRVDRRVSRLLANAENTEPLKALEANVELANVYYRIRQYDKAVERYKLILGAYKKIRRGLQRNPSAQQLLANRFSDQQMALQYYNASCSNALAGDVPEARQLLRRAIQLDPIHFTNVGLDGDLKNLREADGHAEYLKELQALVDEESI